MPNYSYRARDNAGKEVKGIVNALNEADLGNQINKLGCYLISFKQATAFEKMPVSPRQFVRLSPVEVLNFTTQLAISIDAGIPLLSALHDLSKGNTNPKLKLLLEDISRNVESGVSFKDALTAHPQIFSKLYLSIVGAGESTGKLAFVLGDLSKLLEWQLEMHSKIKEASIYPVMLFVVMVGVVAVLVGVVIPKFEPMFAELGVALPLPTQIVLLISKVFRKFWWLMIVSGIGIVAGLKMFGNTENGGYTLDKLKLKLPIFGGLMIKIALSRFCHTFSLALRSGVAVFNAMGIASEVMGNKYFEKSIKKAQDYVNAGERISTALDNSGQFPALVIRMIGVGEQTGALSEVLEKVNQFYDREVPATIKKIFALFEPIMIIVMGVVVGGIAVSVFLPLISIISKIGGD
ncbi:MAG: type II secretion system F family protein [Candidatus Omnitrophica bacterium]|nr:type II secretion system F family protein [Candidatus Omnitrophota bacterium]